MQPQPDFFELEQLLVQPLDLLNKMFMEIHWLRVFRLVRWPLLCHHIHVRNRLPMPTIDSPSSAHAAIDTRSYRADIDGMRAIAILLVLTFHFTPVPAGQAGFLGVDMFFVISGYLITSILKRQLDSGTFDLRSFYLNRVRRLVPALTIVLLMVTTVGAVCLFPTEFIELSKQVLASQLYVANFYYWQSINYFGLNAHDVFLLHTWSLAVEEQFYILYPVCLWLLHSRLRKHFWRAIVLGLLLSFGLNVLYVVQKPGATFYLLPFRAWELLLGALVPWFRQWLPRGIVIDQTIGGVGAVLIVVGVVCYPLDHHFPGSYALLPTLGTAALILSGHDHATPVSKILMWRPFVYVGKISYSLYLVHWPLNVFAQLLINNYSLGWRLTIFVLSFALAALVYQTVENPIRRKRYLSNSRRLLLAYGAGLAVASIAVVVINIENGLPQRFPPNVLRLASFVNDSSEPLTECEYAGQPVMSVTSFCHNGIADEVPTWLVYGDSHAWAAHEAFHKWLTLNHQSGLFVFNYGCPPLIDIHIVGDRESCFKFNRAVSGFIDSQSTISNVVLVSIWRQAIEGVLTSSSETKTTKQQSVELFARQFSRTVQHLSGLGRKVYVWEPVPGARKSVPRELARAAWEHENPGIEFDLAEYLSEYRFFFDALTVNWGWITASFSPSLALCGTGKCAVEIDGIPLYIDSNHISKSTSDFWVKVLQSGESPRCSTVRDAPVHR